MFIDSFMLLVHSLGWGLLHATWMVALAGLLVRVLMRRLDGAAASTRCALILAAIGFAPLSLAGATWLTLSHFPVDALSLPPSGAVLLSGLSAPGGASAAAPAAQGVMPWLVAAWSLGVLAMALRFAGSLRQVRTLRSRGVQPAPPRVQSWADRLVVQLGLRRAVPVLVSSVATIPMVLGAVRPVILLPASTVLGLSPDQLQAVLAHELAHVVRRDLVVVLLQGLVEMVFFFHPTIWWLGRQLAIEREHACDDRVLEVHPRPVVYARALLALEELRGPALGAAATDGSLAHRVERIVGRGRLPQRSPLSLGLLVGVAFLAVCAACSLDGASPEADEAASALDAVAVLETVLDHGGVLACLTESEFPEDQTMLRAKLRLLPDGGVEDFSLLGSVAERDRLEECMWEQVQDLHFDSFDGGAVSLLLPLPLQDRRDRDADGLSRGEVGVLDASADAGGGRLTGGQDHDKVDEPSDGSEEPAARASVEPSDGVIESKPLPAGPVFGGPDSDRPAEHSPAPEAPKSRDLSDLPFMLDLMIRESPALADCLEAAQARGVELSGRHYIKFRIQPDGSLSDAAVRKWDLEEPELGACAADAVNSLSALPFTGIRKKVTYPLYIE